MRSYNLKLLSIPEISLPQNCSKQQNLKLLEEHHLRNVIDDLKKKNLDIEGVQVDICHRLGAANQTNSTPSLTSTLHLLNSPENLTETESGLNKTNGNTQL